MHERGAQPGSEQQRTAAVLHPSTVGAVAQSTKAANTVAHDRNAATLLCAGPPRLALVAEVVVGAVGEGEGEGGLTHLATEDGAATVGLPTHKTAGAASWRTSGGFARVLAGCRGSAGRLRRGRGSKALWWDKFGWSESARGVAARRLLKMRARRRLGDAAEGERGLGSPVLCDVGGDVL